MARPTSKQVEASVAAARQARNTAYAPYSGFRVGAAVLGGSGRVYQGCNVENCAFGVGLCAERLAVGAAVCGGEQTILGLAVFTETSQPTPPCGACRQVLTEMTPDGWVVSACPGAQEVRSVADLLPAAFSREHVETVDREP